MTREEEIIQASEDFGFLEAGEAMFKLGAEWADNHPRTDVIHIDSISNIRMTLVKNFCKIAKMHPNMSINDNPDMKAAYEMIDQFDRACESAGFMLNEDTGFYDIK